MAGESEWLLLGYQKVFCQPCRNWRTMAVWVGAIPQGKGSIDKPLSEQELHCSCRECGNSPNEVVVAIAATRLVTVQQEVFAGR